MLLNLAYTTVKITVDGNTNHSFKKLITSAPIFGTTRLSLIDLSVPKLKSRHIIIIDIGTKSLTSEDFIGQKISFNTDEDTNFFELDINSEINSA